MFNKDDYNKVKRKIVLLDEIQDPHNMGKKKINK